MYYFFSSVLSVITNLFVNFKQLKSNTYSITSVSLYFRMIPFHWHQSQQQLLPVASTSYVQLKKKTGLDSQSFFTPPLPPQHQRNPISHSTCSQNPRHSQFSLSSSSSIVEPATKLLETRLQISPQSQPLPQDGIHIGPPSVK